MRKKQRLQFLPMTEPRGLQNLRAALQDATDKASIQFDKKQLEECFDGLEPSMKEKTMKLAAQVTSLVRERTKVIMAV